MGDPGGTDQGTVGEDWRGVLSVVGMRATETVADKSLQVSKRRSFLESPDQAMWHTVLIAATTALSAVLFELTGKVPFNSDQGIISLMALDILEKGKHPVLCYGSPYGGTIEAHYLAAFFGLFGASPVTFRVAMGALTVFVTLTVWATARLAFGSRAGFFAGMYLALGPAYFLYKCLTSDGGYVSLMLSGGLALFVLLNVEAGLRLGGGRKSLLLILGLLLGSAWWTLPLAAGLIGACACAATIALLPRMATVARPVAWRNLVAPLLSVGVGFVLGAAPWIYHNARVGWVSLKAREMSLVGAKELLINVYSLFQHGWTILLGAWAVWRPGNPSPLAVVLTSGLLIIVIGHGSWRLVREPECGRRFAISLFLAIIGVPAMLSLLARRTDYQEPRYLLLCYLGIGPLCGLLLDRWWSQRARRALLLVVLVALGPVSQLTAKPLYWEITDDVPELDYQLERLGVRDIYASYWLAYRLTFATGGRLSLSPFGSATDGYVRHPDLAAKVDASASPAFLLCCTDRALFESYLAARSIPHHAADVDKFRLFSSLPAGLVAKLRANRAIPLGLRPGDIEWAKPRGPGALNVGHTAEWYVTVRNRGIPMIPSNVMMSYHWERDGAVVIADGLRTKLPPQAADGRITTVTRVIANVPAGTYTLRFDLVQEGWSWFAEFGILPPAVTVQVTEEPTQLGEER